MNEKLFDAAGALGGYLSYSLTIAIVGSAFILFIYLWSKGRLDMDEEPKIQMMSGDTEENS